MPKHADVIKSEGKRLRLCVIYLRSEGAAINEKCIEVAGKAAASRRVQEGD
jgi:hypothetical protein